jgi:hypothetical protein
MSEFLAAISKSQMVIELVCYGLFSSILLGVNGSWWCGRHLHAGCFWKDTSASQPLAWQAYTDPQNSKRVALCHSLKAERIW